MLRTAFLNKKGTSLIEILLSLLLTAVIFTGLLKSSLLVVKANVQNLLRDEAVSIAEQRMTDARNMPFDSLSSEATPTTILRNYRGKTNFKFQSQRTVNNLDNNPTNNKQVQITVSWAPLVSGPTTTHNIYTVVRRL